MFNHLVLILWEEAQQAVCCRPRSTSSINKLKRDADERHVCGFLRRRMSGAGGGYLGKGNISLRRSRWQLVGRHGGGCSFYLARRR